MNMGLVDLKKFRENIDKADFRGKSAYCFIQGDKIIKIYAIMDEWNFIPVDPSKVCDLSVFEADTIVFPDAYIYEEGKKVGEILQYIKNKSVDKSFNDDTIISKVMDSYDQVLGDLLLYFNLDMVDLCQVNILYSNKDGFHIIDTTEWNITNKLCNNNLRRFNSSLIRVLTDYLEIPIIYSRYYNKIDNNYSEAIKKFGHQLPDSLMQLMNGHYDFLNLLYAYMGASKIYYGKDVETLKDIKEFTKVLKKG